MSPEPRRSPSHLLPYEVGRFVVQRGTLPYAFHLKLRREALFTVGVLEKIARIFSAMNVDILQLKASAVGDIVRVIVFADLKGSEALAPRIRDELMKVEFAEEVVFHPSHRRGSRS